MNKDTITKVLLVIVGIIIIFYVVGGTANNLIDGARSVSSANNCSEGVGLTYQLNGSCTGASESYTAGTYSLPLQSVFSPTGVILLVFMAGLLITIITVTIRRYKK